MIEAPTLLILDYASPMPRIRQHRWLKVIWRFLPWAASLFGALVAFDGLSQALRAIDEWGWEVNTVNRGWCGTHRHSIMAAPDCIKAEIGWAAACLVVAMFRPVPRCIATCAVGVTAVSWYYSAGWIQGWL